MTEQVFGMIMMAVFMILLLITGLVQSRYDNDGGDN